MDYQVVCPCTPADAVGLTQVKVQAYWQQDFWRANFPPGTTKEQLIEAITARTPLGLVEDRARCRHQMVKHVPSGEIVGYLWWAMPKEKQGEWLEAQTPAVTAEEEEHFEKLKAAAHWNPVGNKPQNDDEGEDWSLLAPKEPHMGMYDALLLPTCNAQKACLCVFFLTRTLFILNEFLSYLDLAYLAVRPDHQRKGVASLLVEAGCKEADRMNLPVTVSAIGEGAKATYAKAGFELKAEKHKSLQPWGMDSIYDNYFMVRPKARNGE